MPISLAFLRLTWSAPRIIPASFDAYIERVITTSLLYGFFYAGLMRETPIVKETAIHQRSRVVFEEAERRGLSMYVLSLFGRPTNFFTLYNQNSRRHLFEGLPGIDPTRIRTNIDDKEEVRMRLRNIGVPTPEGSSFTRTHDALVYADQIGFPLVVKPRYGSLSAHTTIDIKDTTELVRAIRVAQEISHSFIVERFIPGSLYRATTVGEKVVAVGRRDPPFIFGDGVSTITELIAKCEADQVGLMVTLGYKPEEIPSLPRHHIKADPNSVLPVGEKMAVNLSYGATVNDVTDDVHPDNLFMFEAIAKEVKFPCVGIDFLAPDIAVSWKDQPCAVIELNSLPSIDLHHAPIVKGDVQDVAGAILDYALLKSFGS